MLGYILFGSWLSTETPKRCDGYECPPRYILFGSWLSTETFGALDDCTRAMRRYILFGSWLSTETHP